MDIPLYFLAHLTTETFLEHLICGNFLCFNIRLMSLQGADTNFGCFTHAMIEELSMRMKEFGSVEVSFCKIVAFLPTSTVDLRQTDDVL